MLVVALKQQLAINSYIEDYPDLERDALNRANWTRLYTIKDFL